MRLTSEELKKLKRNLTFRLDGSYDFIKNFDSRAKEAQNIFCDINDLALELPPYDKILKLSKINHQILFDCLNNYSSLFEDLEEDDEDQAQVETEDWDEDCDNNNEYSDYLTNFIPEDIDSSTLTLEIDASVELANRAIAELFDNYINFVEDIIGVKSIYTKLLNEYVHINGKYLNDVELAKAYNSYLTDRRTASRLGNKLFPPCVIELEHAVLIKDNKQILCETYTFEGIGAYLYFDFFRGLKSNYMPKLCSNCGRYFLLRGGKYTDYCESPLPDDPQKTCRDVGARKKYDEKCKTDPVWLTYNRAYKAHYARYMKKKMKVAEFEKWSTYAVELREKAASGELNYDVYYNLIRE